jgi:MFS transporter, MHS family, proline/betaine transporter
VPPIGPATRADRRRALVATCIANVVEWYDFAIFGALSAVLAAVLFPAGPHADALVSVFAVFATSFLARPVGALVAGVHADRHGRQPALVAMVLLMAGATGAIGLLPSWSTIGFAATLGLITLRLLQGFSSGGQITTSITFLTEFAPESRRGWYGGWHTATVAMGLALGLTVATVLTAALAPPQLETWGWRIAFLAALPLGLIGLYIRLRLTETPAFRTVAVSSVTSGQLGRAWHDHRAATVIGFFLVAVLSGGFNLWFVFLPTQLAASEVVDLPTALACALGGLITAAVVAPWAGRLSDRVGRRPVLLAGLGALCLLPLPLYALATRGSATGLLVVDTVIGTALAMLILPAYLAECFPAEVRATGLGLTVGLATALIGGTAPLVAALLAQRGLVAAAPVYLTILAVCGLAAMIRASSVTPQWVIAHDSEPTGHSPNGDGSVGAPATPRPGVE